MSSAEMSHILWMKFKFRIETLFFILVVSSHGASCWRNFALNKFAYQSSTIYFNGFNWTAGNAVDGNKDGSSPGNSRTCSATNVSLGNHTWEVDIGFQIMVKNITVYGRTDTDQLSGFQVFVGNSSSPWKLNRPLTAQSSTNLTTVFSSINVPVRFVSVARFNRTILTLCEVTVEGECLDGVYSEFCNLTCGRCNQSRTCDMDTGACLYGCDKGWMGLRCDAECEKGTYDSGCQETCGRCLTGNTSCSTIDGHCTDGCQEGWKGEKCKIECKKGTYGRGCVETCGHCLNGNNKCSTTDGHCMNSCLEGWRGETCKKECENGTYGPGCQETCGRCLNGNSNCSKLNGYCAKGCEAGWKGATCKIGCEQGRYGIGCVETCGGCFNNKSCSNTDGQCTDGCQSGWRGNTCKIEGDHGTFGRGCQGKCGNCINGSCSVKYGSCLFGCVAGWLGETCTIGQNPTSPGVNVAAIGGAVGGVVVVGVLIIVTIIILKWKRRVSTDKNTQMRNIPTHNKDHETSESYCEIGNYSTAGKPINNTSKEGQSNDDYEKLGNSSAIDVSVYSVIDISAKENNKKETIQLNAGSNVEYAQQLLTLETELKAMEEQKKNILMKKKKILKKLAKSEYTEKLKTL